ncbi:MAG: type II toxin-antitoxin system HicB family antitoxin, partial [Okeania sp. SIO1H6]|nr:type II toxin-antitoxin system HicB family antitoxin [Okeania sp. SIO1H6]
LPDNVVKVGHWGHDSRGSNQFLDCTVMIDIGDYTENLGANAADWHCTMGQSVNPTNLSGRYGRYIQRRRIADLEQVIGRPRATNRPDEEITIYLPGKWKEDEISAIASRLPGVNIEKVATYDLCQKAAQKGQQSQRKIIETFWDLITSQQDVTQDNIAKIVGLSRGRVAQICKDLLPTSFVRFKKMLVLLWNNLSKTNIPKKALSELPEDVGWFVEQWLPNFHEYVQQGETLEEVAQNIELAIEFHGKQILDYVSVDTIVDLIKLFMAPMPISFWEELRMQAEPIPIPIPK